MCLCNGTACSPEASCIGQTCACNAGYEGNGTECEPDEDEFNSSAGRSAHALSLTALVVLACAATLGMA
eukprot:1279724-Rhodomonas_salina.1